MAVKWAMTNGNWNNPAIWNDSVVPTIGDEVYCNGHTITANVTIDIGNGTISNDVCPNTGNSGGAITFGIANATRYITANIVTGATPILLLSNAQGTGYQINGDIYMSETLGVATFNRTGTGVGSPNYLYVNGNIYPRAGYFCNMNPTTQCNVSINGNIEQITNIFLYSSYANTVFNFELNGILKTSSTTAFANRTITAFANNGIVYLNRGLTVTNYNQTGGKLVLAQNISLSTTTTTISGGGIEYENTQNRFGLIYTNLSITNDDFYWYDVTSPRVNKIIIINPLTIQNTYPNESDVRQGVVYGSQNELIGTFTVDYPPESVVLNGYEYDNGNMTGSMSAQAQVGCVTKEDVREGVPLIGMGEVGTLIVPSVDDVREGVVFDNGSVGTLIVQGGGDRLRIADFGYYTRSTSITYIVDLTESDKPAFADCEEIVLRSLFPTLDLDNIPDKFFDDLFVQFLRYRLLVEYYRGTSINSKFTPSEPTSEIVNYANSKCEYWLNTANLFLQLWGEKYPNSVKKDRILL